MSFAAFVWAWEQPIENAAELLVLLCLADIAGESGEVFASHRYIADRCRRSERHVRAMLDALEGRFIRTTERPGRTDLVTLLIPDEFSVKKRGFVMSGDLEVGKRGRPRKRAAIEGEKGGNLAQKGVAQIADEPSEEPKKEPREAKASDARGTRLAENWEPDIVAATIIGLTEAEAIDQGARFKDYWLGVPGAKGRKADWPATWRNWCRRVAEERQHGRGSPVTRPHSGGIDFAAERAEARGRDIIAGAAQVAHGVGRRRWRL